MFVNEVLKGVSNVKFGKKINTPLVSKLIAKFVSSLDTYEWQILTFHKKHIVILVSLRCIL